MGSDSRLIYYSTIHLNRREEILIQSIISLYSSKDSYRWIYREAGDDIGVVVVGSEAKALIDAGSDPYVALKSRYIIIMLGDLFYPKNARALVRIGLPIKALDLVDKLRYIERSIISKPVSIEYIVTKPAVAIKEVQGSNIPPNQNELIEFVVSKPIIGTKDLESLAENENSINNAEESQCVTQEAVKEEIIATNLSLQNTTESTGVDHIDSDEISFPQETDTNKNIKLNNFSNFKFTFFDGQLGREDLLTPVSFRRESMDLVSKETFDNVSSPIEVDTDISVVKPATTETDEENTVVSKEAVDYIMPDVKTYSISDAPTLTEVVPKYLLCSTNVVPLYTNNVQSVSVAGFNSIAQASQPAISEDVVAITPSHVASLTIADEQPQAVLEADVNSEFSKRIKLLRWPKSEVIQRHPGNAILASMVINIPMSVEDMAKQSDLPLLICKKFVDAVIESNVAMYVDLPESVDQPISIEPTSEVIVDNQEEIKPDEEKKVKRKGIFYRIRAALGLLRK